jgi:hypothetical protein
MTDKELLKLAAKAADYGFFFNRKISDDSYEWKSDDGMLWQWNPLIDDGQAMRLAVKLNMDIVFDFDRVMVVFGDVDASCSTEYFYELPKPTDRYAATRRAIVRAAAEMEKDND